MKAEKKNNANLPERLPTAREQNKPEGCGGIKKQRPEGLCWSLAQKGRPSPPVSFCMVSAASASAERMASLTAATIMS